jgi:probable rRNA maturation factor
MKSAINFFTENIRFTLRKKTIIRNWIIMILASEKKQAGNINFVFCDDGYLSQMNVKYLKHKTLTDIITFSFCENARDIHGDIFISVQRVRENAEKFDQLFCDELHRVMIHGVLHLAGYEDSTKKEKVLMREQENVGLLKLEKLVGNPYVKR